MDKEKELENLKVRLVHFNEIIQKVVYLFNPV
jgi:hypothetical protein